MMPTAYSLDYEHDGDEWKPRYTLEKVNEPTATTVSPMKQNLIIKIIVAFIIAEIILNARGV